MDIGLYSIYDVKGERYDTPFFSQSDLFAERKFIVNCRNNDSILSNFKNDFSLVKIGVFDYESGELVIDRKVIMEGKNVQEEIK